MNLSSARPQHARGRKASQFGPRYRAMNLSSASPQYTRGRKASQFSPRYRVSRWLPWWNKRCTHALSVAATVVYRFSSDGLGRLCPTRGCPRKGPPRVDAHGVVC
eukprot:1485898-Prymnesium_polylepis.1